MLKTKDLKET